MASRRNWVIVAAGSLLLAACGGGDDSATTTVAPTAAPTTSAETSAPTTSPTATTEASSGETSGEITSFDQVQPAVVQIVAQGSFRDPEVGQTVFAGSGSGFIVSPDGIAVTNNHVVAGAATLEVWVGGENDTSYNAKILGVSECNDLAVIQIDTNDPLPSLAWQDTPATVGEEIYAAGFPLGDPEFTLTSGIVAKAKASGDTSWASIDAIIEHDANIQPGNSGGPLIATDGRVVAVNYAGGSPTNTEQFFAIESSLAQDVVAELMNGDYESLGVNGSAVVDEEAGIAGIWVSGVAPGTPVDAAGVLPGDIITSLNGLPVGTDGTMKDYCDVIRTSGSDKPIQIEVLRFDTQEYLAGELNNPDKPLTQTFSFAEEVGDVNTATATSYSGYTSVVDDTGAITVDVPNEWTSVVTSPLTLDDGTVLPYIEASTDSAAFNSTYDTPGLFFTVFEAQSANVDDTIANFDPGTGCTSDGGADDYSDAVFTGRYHLWTGCGAAGATYIVLAAVPADASYTAVLVMQVLTDADWEALDQAFNTFNVVG